MRGTFKLLASTALLCVIGQQAMAQGATATIANVTTVTEENLRNPSPADWLHLGGNYEHWNYSRLDQINRDTVGGLNLAWARQMVQGGQAEVSPIIHDGVMFLPNPFDTLTAIDAATGSKIWEYKRTGMPEVGGRDEENKIRHTYSNRKRGIAIYGDTIIHTGSDDTVIAVDARSGQVVWETRRSTTGWSNSSTGAIVANGIVVTGGSCQNAPINCFVTGHDVANGEELWRNEVVPRPGEPGDETWGGVAYENRYCAGVWGQLMYDPVTNLVNYGSTGLCPAPDVQRGVVGKNATAAGTNERWSVRPDTGEVVWRRQIIAQDNWDQECTFEMMAVDTPIRPNPNMEGALAVNPATHGTTRALVGMPCKNPVFWALDAATGAFFYARETFVGAQNIYDTIDPVTGAVTMNQEVVYTEPGQNMFWCTSHGGGRDWPSGAYDPTRNLMIQPTANICTDGTSRTDREPAPGFNYNVTNVDKPNPNVPNMADGQYPVGRITAVNVETGNTAWQYLQRADNYAPVLATAGGLLFNGDGARNFFALNIETGEKVWSVRLGSALGGYPVTYSVDGRQYVGIAAGYGRQRLAPELDMPLGGNTMYVFALPE